MSLNYENTESNSSSRKYPKPPNSTQAPRGPAPPDFNTLMLNLKGMSETLWFVATSKEMDTSGSSDMLHWISRELSDMHDQLFNALEAEDIDAGRKVVVRG